MDKMSQTNFSQQASETPEENPADIDALMKKLTDGIDNIANASKYFDEYIESTDKARLTKISVWEVCNGYDKASCEEVNYSFENLLSKVAEEKSSFNIIGTELVQFSQKLCQLMKKNNETPSRIVRSLNTINLHIIVLLIESRGLQVFIPQIGDVWDEDKMETEQKKWFGKKIITAVESWGVMNMEDNTVIKKANVSL